MLRPERTAAALAGTWVAVDTNETAAAEGGVRIMDAVTVVTGGRGEVVGRTTDEAKGRGVMGRGVLVAATVVTGGIALDGRGVVEVGGLEEMGGTCCSTVPGSRGSE